MSLTVVHRAEGLTPAGNAKLRSHTWANAAARMTITPDFVGQYGYQVSDGSLWKARARIVGSWRRVIELDFPVENMATDGSGTDDDPYVGWESAVEALPSGTSPYFGPFVFEAAREVGISKPFVNPRGAGSMVTTIRGTDAAAGKAIFRFSYPDLTHGIHTRSGGYTLDGGGVVDVGLFLRDCDFSDFYDIVFRNIQDHLIDGSRCISSTFRNLKFHENFNQVGDVTPAHGIRLGGTDPLGLSDTACMHCTFNGIEFAGITGKAFEIVVGSYNKVTGGAFEVCGQPIVLGEITRAISFEGVNTENSSGAGNSIGGSEHCFKCHNATGTATTYPATSTGGHRWENSNFDVVTTDNGTGVNSYDQCAGATFAGSNKDNNIKIPAGGLSVSKSGPFVREIVSSDSGGPVGVRFTQVGNDFTYVLGYPSAGLYGIQSAALPLNPSNAQAEGAYGWKVYGRDLWTGRDVTVGRDLTVTRNIGVSGQITMPGMILTSPSGDLVLDNGSAAKFRLLAFASDGYFDLLGAGDWIFRPNQVERVRFLLAGGVQQKNVTSVPGTPSGGGVLYVEAGALKYKGSSGTITTLGVA